MTPTLPSPIYRGRVREGVYALIISLAS